MTLTTAATATLAVSRLLTSTPADWPGSAWLTGLGLAALAAAVYAGSCWWFPFAHCGRCGGAGRHTRGDGRVYRLCRRCAGTGRRLRVGRRIYNHYARVRADGIPRPPRSGRGGTR